MMANTRRPRVSQPQDEDIITFVPPITVLPPASSTNTPHRPTLPQQVVDVVKAKQTTRPATARPPGQGPPSARQGTRGTRQRADSFELVDFDNVEDGPQPDKENYWRNLQLLICFWKSKRRRRRSTPNGRPANDSTPDATWKRFRGYFSRKSSTATPTLGNVGQQTSSPSAPAEDAGTAAAPGGSGANTTAATNRADRGTLPLDEVDTLLEQHRSKFSAGHEGQLREPPNPNNPATPRRPMPKLAERRNRPPPPPVPAARVVAVASAGPSGSLYSPGIIPPSSQAEYLSNPDDFYGGPSFSHSEDVSMSRSVQDDMESMTVDDQHEDPRSPQNSPVNNTIPGGTKAQIERNNDLSGLVSEDRYPPSSPLVLGNSSTRETSRVVPSQSHYAIIETIAQRLHSRSQGESQSANPNPRNNEAQCGVTVEVEEVDEDDSSSSSDDYWLEGDEPEIPSRDLRPQERRSRLRLDPIDEAGERGEGEGVEGREASNYIFSQNRPPDAAIPEPAITVTMEDVHNERSWVYESSGEEDEGLRPRVDKGKGIDKEAHPNYDSYVGYTRIRTNNDPGFEPGPSDWQERPRIGDMPMDYFYEDDELD